MLCVVIVRHGIVGCRALSSSGVGHRASGVRRWALGIGPQASSLSGLVIVGRRRHRAPLGILLVVLPHHCHHCCCRAVRCHCCRRFAVSHDRRACARCLGFAARWTHSMEITVYHPRILVEYCDLMTSISTVSQGFLFCCIFKISQPVS
jgi:hypothetical protein